MSIHLSCGALGVKASQTEAIDYAARFGFDSVDADGRYLGELPPADLSRLLDSMKCEECRVGDRRLPHGVSQGRCRVQRIGEGPAGVCRGAGARGSQARHHLDLA